MSGVETVELAQFSPAIALLWLSTEPLAELDVNEQAVTEAILSAHKGDEKVLDHDQAQRIQSAFDEAAAASASFSLNKTAKLQNCRGGALLWIQPNLSGIYDVANALAHIKAVTTLHGWKLWQVNQGIGITLSPFDEAQASSMIELAQLALKHSTLQAAQRRSHFMLITLLCVVLSAAGLLYAKQNPWQGFLIAVIYAPLLIAAVLTLVLIVQRLKASFFSSSP